MSHASTKATLLISGGALAALASSPLWLEGRSVPGGPRAVANVSGDIARASDSADGEADSTEVQRVASIRYPALAEASMHAAIYAGAKVQQAVGAFEDADGRASVLGLTYREVDPVNGDTYGWFRKYATSKVIVGFSRRSFNDLLVAFDAGATIEVERWLIPDSPGGWTINSPVSSLGVPVTTPTRTREIVGSSWLPPAERPADTTPETRVHLQSLPVGTRGVSELRCLGADPDGRFFVAVFRDRIEQHDLRVPNGSPLWTLPAAKAGRDFGRIDSADFMDTSSHGRVIYLQGESPRGENFVLIDANNDAVIESTSHAAVPTFSQSNPYIGSRTRQF